MTVSSNEINITGRSLIGRAASLYLVTIDNRLMQVRVLPPRLISRIVRLTGSGLLPRKQKTSVQIRHDASTFNDINSRGRKQIDDHPGSWLVS